MKVFKPPSFFYIITANTLINKRFSNKRNRDFVRTISQKNRQKLAGYSQNYQMVETKRVIPKPTGYCFNQVSK